MIPTIPPAQASTAASPVSRLAAAGARGVSAVNRDNPVEASSEQYTYNPDSDGILFNAYIQGKDQQAGQGGGGGKNSREDEDAARATRNAKRGSKIARSDGALPEGGFGDFLPPDVPIDLRADLPGTSFYAVVNAVVHGVQQRGQNLDFRI